MKSGVRAGAARKKYMCVGGWGVYLNGSGFFQLF